MNKQIWEIQPKESVKSYNAFCIYRNMGCERTLEKTCQILGKEWAKYHSQLKDWSSRFNWRQRSRAYDSYLEGIIREASERELIKISKTQLKTIDDLIKLFNVPLSIRLYLIR